MKRDGVVKRLVRDGKLNVPDLEEVTEDEVDDGDGGLIVEDIMMKPIVVSNEESKVQDDNECASVERGGEITEIKDEDIESFLNVDEERKANIEEEEKSVCALEDVEVTLEDEHVPVVTKILEFQTSPDIGEGKDSAQHPEGSKERTSEEIDDEVYYNAFAASGLMRPVGEDDAYLIQGIIKYF